MGIMTEIFKETIKAETEVKDSIYSEVNVMPINEKLTETYDVSDTPERKEKNEVNGEMKESLSFYEKTYIKIEQPSWSFEVINEIGSMEEYKIYKKADLEEVKIDDKPCLIRDDIDMKQKDEFGRTNKERMTDGLSPISPEGETIELHHIGQKSDSPLAELITTEHRGRGNDTVLHDKQKETEIDRNEFKKEREAHWESRAIMDGEKQ